LFLIGVSGLGAAFAARSQRLTLLRDNSLRGKNPPLRTQLIFAGVKTHRSALSKPSTIIDRQNGRTRKPGVSERMQGARYTVSAAPELPAGDALRGPRGPITATRKAQIRRNCRGKRKCRAENLSRANPCILLLDASPV
jgi:hypothetical protein